jgi:hypothetical protein
MGLLGGGGRAAHPKRLTDMDICLRFITDGIRDTMDHYRRDDLPLHRLTWELCQRIDTLVPHAPAVWIDQLRDLQRRVAELHARGEHAELTDLERGALHDSMRQLRAVLGLDRS